MKVEESFTADSLSAESGTWSNEGTLGSDVDISSLTGTVQSESTNGGGSINALCFDSSQTAQSDITYIQYDTNSEVRPDLTMEVWWRPDEYADSTDWILGHDDGGYDRGITTYDTNFGGLSMGIGASYSSTVSYPDVGEWTHIVATWSSDGTATLYKNGGDSAGGSQQTKSISSDSGSRYEYIGLNGLALYSGHTVIGCFAQVQLVNRAVTADEAADLYAAFGSAMNSTSAASAEPTAVSSRSPSAEPTSSPSKSPSAEPTTTAPTTEPSESPWYFIVGDELMTWGEAEDWCLNNYGRHLVSIHNDSQNNAASDAC